ncbi:MAG: TonB-dependent receptor [Lewinellaceae bacterium]|nr:TonB-dependent receptor [Lewinellaceae bacterium]
MKTKYALLFAALLLFPLLLQAQKVNLRGTVVDTASAPLAGGTVMLLAASDSALLAFTRTGEAGDFTFKNLSEGDYLLRCTYFGYQSFQQPVRLDAGKGPVTDLGTLQMQLRSELLSEVEIKGEANPVTLKQDTIEFNAGSFKVKENAVVEDLLKKLPGVEVERDGTVRAQGEEVKNVMVDGKKFFGNDPKVATKNLPADAVDKVQVFDKKSDQAVFSGVDDGQREKTINLELKEDKKNGWFGRAVAGAGSDLNAGGSDGGDELRFEGNLSLNRFKPGQQISILGMGNNVNQAGFSIDDYLAFSGAMRQMMGGGGGRVQLQFNQDGDNDLPLDFGDNQGFLRTWAGGVNFNQEFGKKADLNSSYMYSNSDKEYGRTSTRQSFLPDGDFSTLSQSAENNITDNHRLNLTYDQKIDSFNSVQFNSAFTYSQREAFSGSGSQTFGAGQVLQNEGNRTYQSDASGTNWTGNLLFRHKFARKGRNFSANVNFGLNNNDSESSSISENKFFDDGGQAARVDTVAQDQLFANDVGNWGARGTYTEPLGKRRYLEFNYGYFRTENRADKDVYNVTNGERYYDDLLSNTYTNIFGYHRGGAGFRINRKFWNGSIGIDAQSATLEGEVNSGQGAAVKQQFEHVLPRMDFQYQFAPSRNLRLFYNTDINAPSVQQLQPVPDVSDPLNIIEGNPELKPSYGHNVSLNFMSFNPENMRSFFSGVFFTYTKDRIVNAQNVDSSFVRRYRPVNVDSDYRLNGTFAFGLPWKKIESRFNLRSEIGFNRGQNFINDRENFTGSLALTQSVSWDFTPAEWFNLSAGAELTWNQTHYSLDKAFNQDYLTQLYNAECTVDLPLDFSVGSDLDVRVNGGLGEGYNRAVPIWNASVSRFFMKNKRLQLTIAVHDLLNRNVSINRVTNLNYVEDERVASLGRYGMLRLTYALNSMAGGGRPGFRFIMRR